MEISRSDCDKILKKLGKNLKILKYQQVPFEERNGYLGEHCTLEITTEEKIFTFFVKFPPLVPSQREFLDEINGIFKEEQFFCKYHELLKQNGINVLDQAIPKCYHISNGTFVFEDLTRRGYKTFASRSPLKIEYVKAALSSFAKLHSSGLIFEEINALRLPDQFQLNESFYHGTGTSEEAIEACKYGIHALIDLTYREDPKLSKELFKKKASEGCDLQKFFARPSKKFRNTICHADPWTKNFLFKEEGEEIDCVIVDFQTYRYAPPAQDVVSFIHLVTEKSMRDNHFEELLQFYFEELRNNLKKFNCENIVTREEFFESCRFYKHFALTQTLTHFHVVILSDEIAKELFGDPKKAKYVLFRNRYDFVKMVYERDPVSRKMNDDAIEDLRQFFLLSLT